MLKDKIRDLYLKADYNCAESLLLAANQEYQLGIGPEELKLISGFGAGMCCGKSCGALCGSVAAIGKLAVTGRAHATQGFQELCGGFVKQFQERFQSCDCQELKPRYFAEQVRCLGLVEEAADLLEAYLKESGWSGKPLG